MGDTDEEEADDEEVETPTTPTKPTTPTTPQQPTGVRYTTTYKVPVSDPNGHTDLAVKFLGVGTIDDGKFIKQDELDVDEIGAVQFEVKNIGTKTSTAWEFEMELPSGSDYSSKNKQVALKPNERSVLTILFGLPGDEGKQDFSVKVTGGGDTKTSNNSFAVKVEITD